MRGNTLSILLMVIIFLIIPVYSQASAREITVDGDNSDADFKSIQEAVNNSSPGDLICVYPGYYNETVDIVMQNISILAKSENPKDTTARAFKFSASYITLNGFTIQDNLLLQGYIGNFSHSKIENCTVKNNILESGIEVNECYNSIIEKNIILNFGIMVAGPYEDSNLAILDNLLIKDGIGVTHGPSNCILLNNTVLNGGVSVTSCTNDNKILGNYISNSSDSGIFLFEASYNYIENNTIENCTDGIILTRLTGNNIVYNNTIKYSDNGILVADSGRNIFSNNTILKNNIGILLCGSTIDQAGNNSLLNNTVSDNNIGISLEGDSSGNLMTNNRLERNKQYGVYIRQVNSELQYDGVNQFSNNIFNNTINFFNNTSSYTGNYYIANAKNISAGRISVSLNTTEASNGSISPPNIIGGPYLGGNFWAKPDGTGFSQTCNDWNKDGIGDSYYTINAYDVDYFPLVSITKQEKRIFPVANFSTNITGGNVPLSVQFMDFSQNATSRVWDFDNDGIIDSTNETVVYTYPVSGTYTVNLTVKNSNGSFSKLYPITAFNRPQYALTETQITTNVSNQALTDIYGDKIVYLDDRRGLGYYSDIYMYDLSTLKEFRITSNSSSFDYNTGPSIYGNKIVWEELQYNSSINGWDRSNIHMYDLSTSKETKITGSGKAGEPDIYKDRIVYTDLRDGNVDIFMYNLSTTKETRITTNKSWQGDPAIYGDIIVWQDRRNGENSRPPDIYMYNLSTSKELQITNGTSDQYSPVAAFEDKIAWTDSRNENRDIYVYDISTSKEMQIKASENYQVDCDIYGDRIVWADDRNGNTDIYMYDLSTHTETQITSNKSSQEKPVIYGNKVVWMDWRNEYSSEYRVTNPSYRKNSDIYMCTISEVDSTLKTPIVDFYANRKSGSAPLKFYLLITVQVLQLSGTGTSETVPVQNML